MDFIPFLLTFLLVVVPSVLFLRWYRKWKEIANIVNKIRGPPTYPIIGTVYEILVPRNEIFDKMQGRCQEYKPVFRTWLGWHPEVHILKAEYVEEILNSTKLISKGSIYKLLQPWLGFGLLTSTGSKWHLHRKLITPTFHFKILENFMEIFVEKGQKLANDLKPMENGEVFNIYPYLTESTLNIICETAMGVELNTMDKDKMNYTASVYEMSELILQRAMRPWYSNDFIFSMSNLGKRYKQCLDTLHNFTIQVIRERKKKLKGSQHSQETDELVPGKKRRLAFLDLLLEAAKNGADLTDKDIREEVDTFMFEGHDTTTAAISWTLFMIGNHPDVQEKVSEELDCIFHGEDRPITMSDLGEMKYLERVIKETLRLYPSVPFISREVTHDITVGGYAVPTGCTAVLHIYDVHRDEDHYTNPLEFDPDNFLPEKCKKRHPFAFIPFSAGPRNCIGQKFAMIEEKTILASILRKYRITAIDRPSDIKIYPELVLKPQKGIKIKIETKY